MKKIYYMMLVSASLLMACGSDQTKVTTTEKNGDGTETKTEVDVKGLNTVADEMNKRMETLKNLTPLTIEQMKAILPEEFDGARQRNYSASAIMGYALTSASYNIDKGKELEIQLIDCAGEKGALFYSTAYLSGLNFQTENENEYTKSIDFMGGRAIENYRKKQNYSTLTYIVDDRLMVVLQGEDMSPDELKDAAKKMDLKL